MDVVIIATLRPEILKITLSSFSKKILNNYDVRAIVNVDSVGDANCSPVDVLNVCSHYFPNIVSRTPATPSFSSAVEWCWSQVNTEIFLHLEDDWCLKKKIDPVKIEKAFENKDVVSQRLNLKSNKEHLSDGEIVYATGLGLNPSFFRLSYIKKLLRDFDLSRDPEKQFSSKAQELRKDKLPPPYPIFLIYGEPNESSYVIDTGKKWRKRIGLSKWSEKSTNGITWELKRNNLIRNLFSSIKYHLYLYYWKKMYCR